MYKPVCCSVMLRVVSESRLFMQNLPEHEVPDLFYSRHLSDSTVVTQPGDRIKLLAVFSIHRPIKVRIRTSIAYMSKECMAEPEHCGWGQNHYCARQMQTLHAAETVFDPSSHTGPLGPPLREW